MTTYSMFWSSYARIVFDRSSKSMFCQQQVNYLGHRITTDGIKPLQRNLAAIVDFKQLTDRAELLHFLGVCNYYQSFMKNAATILHPLTAIDSCSSMALVAGL